jgi:formamidopyrimidine-DNA glycosylase
MPELPEVETVVVNLRSQVLNQKINNITILCPKIFSDSDSKLVDQQTILDVKRRGKYIILVLSYGYLVVHLRMTGKFFVIQKSELDLHTKHLHVIFDLEKSPLLFCDQRKFGKINFCQDLNWLEKKLGPEPLGDKFTKDYLANIFQNSKKQIKALLLDQAKIAGLGNIYVDEVLWQARVHPKRLANLISKPEIKLIYDAILQILQDAINMQGTTFLSYAFDGNKKGNYLSYLKVFNRAKLPCLGCQNIIVKIKVAQRGTHVCEICQK